MNKITPNRSACLSDRRAMAQELDEKILSEQANVVGALLYSRPLPYILAHP
jgi:hypothetical protein